jgi:hypothetical protein
MDFDELSWHTLNAYSETAVILAYFVLIFEQRTSRIKTRILAATPRYHATSSSSKHEVQVNNI